MEEALCLDAAVANLRLRMLSVTNKYRADFSHRHSKTVQLGEDFKTCHKTEWSGILRTLN
jgi:hypothetical protein